MVVRYLLETCDTVDEAAMRTQERLRAIRAAGADVAAMLKPPLYRSVDEQGSRTLYTARYRPVEGRIPHRDLGPGQLSLASQWVLTGS